MKSLIGIMQILFFLTPIVSESQSLLVPMDRDQKNHLKAYGLTYWALDQYSGAEWLLNYRGGSFLLPDVGCWIVDLDQIEASIVDVDAIVSATKDVELVSVRGSSGMVNADRH